MDSSDVTQPSQHSFLLTSITEHKAHIGVIGLGYVGLPLVRLFCLEGFTVTGFDSDPEKIRLLSGGRSYLSHIPDEDIKSLVEGERFRVASDFEALSEVDVVIVCVPTPLNRRREPDMSAVVASAEVIGEHLHVGQLVVLESSTWPGTTDELVRPILERSGLVSGNDFYLAYAPEREDPGNVVYGISAIPRVVGADGEDARILAEALYEQIASRVISVVDSRTAEAVKLTENVFRAVNIALVNELKIIFQAMDIDVWDVIEAASSKPFGYMPFYPGPGMGGHCIPVDPFYLAWKAREYGVEARFVTLAGEINTAMPDIVIKRLRVALEQYRKRSLEGARVLILGMAYKKEVNDTRESPALAIMDKLQAHGVECVYHDPYVPVIPKTRAHGGLAGQSGVALTPEVLGVQDAVLIVTDHESVDYAMVCDHAALVVDTRNVAPDRGKSVVVRA